MPNKKYWVCTINGCGVYAHTDINPDYLSSGTTDHGYPANPELIQVQKTREQIKQRARNEVAPTGKKYDEEITKNVLNSVAVGYLDSVSVNHDRHNIICLADLIHEILF
ncbi:unnamed protein product [Rotaria sp. Silwood1]|nr:unnamed protein product [Rotaria sp. Silwood1]